MGFFRGWGAGRGGGRGGGSGTLFQTEGPKTEKDLFSRGLKRRTRNCQQSDAKKAQRPGRI